MKKQRTKTRRRNPRIHNPLAGIESLEARQVLAANLLSSTVNSISSPTDSDDLALTLDIPSGATGTFVLQATAADGSLNPAAPVVQDLAGNTLPVVSSVSNAAGSGGMTVIDLSSGEYNVVIAGESGTTGGYTVDIALLGDVQAADTRVSSAENMQASAALIQAMGTGNHVTDLYYLQQGIDMRVDQFDAGFDANMNGRVDASEVAMVQANAGIGIVSADLQSDVDGPVINLALTNDTGVSNSDGATTDATIQATLTDDSTITTIVASLDLGSEVDITANFVDVNSFTITPAILDTIAGGSLNDGAHTLSLTATDEFGNASTQELSFTLISNNGAPELSASGATRTINEDDPFTLDLNTIFTDPNPDDILSYQLATGSTLPGWLTLNGSVLSGTPENSDVGPFQFAITATDSQAATVNGTLNITVENTPDAPVIAPIADQSVEDDSFFSLNIGNSVSDVDPGDVVTISVDQADGVENGAPVNLRALPAWLTFDNATNILSGTPTDADVGVVGISVVASDLAGQTDAAFFTITVTDLGEPPVFDAIGPDTATEDVPYSIDFSQLVNDPDLNDTLTFSTQLAGGGSLPSWLSLNSTSGVLSGTPGDGDVGVVLNIEVTATDLTGLSDTATYELTVVNVNDDPQVNDQTIRVRPDVNPGTVVGNVNATDVDTNDTLTISVPGGSGSVGFDVDPSTGDITYNGNQALTDGETLILNVTVTDDGTPQGSDTAVIMLQISSNAQPVANDDSGFTTEEIEPLVIAASDLVSNDTDADGDTLTVDSVNNSSLGATVTLDNGQVTYDAFASTELLALRPGETRVDTFTYTVSDGNGGTDTATVSVTVVGTDSVEFTLRTVDMAGNEITTIDPNTDFQLVVTMQDLRSIATATTGGVFAGYLDVTYTASLASITGPIEHSPDYNIAAFGDTSVPGLIDDAGGADGLDQKGNVEIELWRIPMRSSETPGVIQFASDPADDLVQRAVLVFLDNRRTPEQQIVYGTTELTVGGLAPPLSNSTPATNFDNPYDVDGDEFVTPLDALIVINNIGETSVAGMFPDVNTDGHISPQDALMVVNEIEAAKAPLSSGVVVGNDADSDEEHTTIVDEFFAQLGN